MVIYIFFEDSAKAERKLIVLYNAFCHIQSQWTEIERECKRVLKAEGVIYVAATWKMDVHIMMDVFGDEAKWRDQFLIVEIRK